jgi:hypothetical protein
MENKMAEHDTAIEDLKGFRKSTIKRLDSQDLKLDGISTQLQTLFAKLSKPLFTPFQIFGISVVLIGYMASVMIFGGDIKSDVRVNTIGVENNNENWSHFMKIQELHFEKFQVKLDQILIDVAVLKSEKEE